MLVVTKFLAGPIAHGGNFTHLNFGALEIQIFSVRANLPDLVLEQDLEKKKFFFANTSSSGIKVDHFVHNFTGFSDNGSDFMV